MIEQVVVHSSHSMYAHMQTSMHIYIYSKIYLHRELYYIYSPWEKNDFQYKTTQKVLNNLFTLETATEEKRNPVSPYPKVL